MPGSWKNVTSDWTADLALYCGAFIDASSGNRTVTLPSIVNKDTSQFKAKRIDSSLLTTVTIVGASGETIDGANSKTLLAGNAIALISNQGKWYIVATA